MKRLLFCGLLCSCLSTLPIQDAMSQDSIPAPASGVKDVNSYALGLEMGSQLRRQGFEAGDLDTASVALGIFDAISKANPKITTEQIQAAFQAIDAQLQQRAEARVREQKEKMEAIAGPNKEKADAFLAANGKKPGVVTLPSGLQYQVIKEGTGASPTAQSTVSVHYTGKLINGEVFDSSVERGQPARFGVGQVIRGWTEGLQKMKVGDKWMLYIPPDLGYGINGSPSRDPSEPPTIGPNEALIFEVELLDILD
ncbi:Peptidyl-prolyl cis-trans isomerase Mip precursor [Rosistilla carotiformis]|uniref:Peptidyl-prolyl cis-trans isomerase n=1 Tax=Rosistilla carotiformis TaxID=2528017 RepID=A0A518JM87_9BACT|nr:FKBP-type peptidyl-prolyl cis-trans isomerase [Rosistilla carotiformis]QDV66597.1 Peptidyl-prolyl cis-trans isomerase Mip precursor [Rosistilla carotiformis]